MVPGAVTLAIPPTLLIGQPGGGHDGQRNTPSRAVVTVELL